MVFLYAGRYTLNAVFRYTLPAVLILSAIRYTLPAVALAEEVGSPEALRFASADFLYRQQRFSEALEQFGQLPKTAHQDPGFRQRVGRALEALYQPQEKDLRLKSQAAANARVIQRLRVVRRKYDADQNSDQSGDNRGLQVNEHLEAETQGLNDSKARFVMDLDGFKNGHNDVRYRTLLADFFKGSSHFALGDSASYPSPFFLRGSRFRGLNFLMSGERNEFQAVLGAYPVWLESRDEYVYPRTVWGIRDRIEALEDRLKFGVNLIQTRDSEKIRTEDGANPQARVGVEIQPRDNIVFGLDQEFLLIPDVWMVKAGEGYSVTDDNLLEDRFGDTTKLKDTAFYLESTFSQPLVRWQGSLERIGPDYRFLTDLPQGAVNSPKDVRADTLRMIQSLDFNPLGPLDLDLEASWARNNLDHDAAIEQTRQSWYTANLGILTPPAWPRPYLRSTLVKTVSVPGSADRPSQTVTWDVAGELNKSFGLTAWAGFAGYQVESPQADRGIFDEKETWGLGTRVSRPLGERLLASVRYQYQQKEEDEFVDGVFDGRRWRSPSQGYELNGHLNVRLWSTASLGLSETFSRGRLKIPEPNRMRFTTHGYATTAALSWPYTRFSRDRKRKLSVSPGLTYHLTDIGRDLEERALFTGRLRLAYEALQDWKVELMGEFRSDDDDENDRVDTEASRLMLLWTSYWR